MRSGGLIYLDNAATSWPKPPGVAAEMLRCLRDYCGNPGRGSHSMSLAASKKIYECRERIARMFGGLPENTVLTQNTTHALNIAVKSAVGEGGHILISDMEHNSVLRPVAALAARGIAGYGVYKTGDGEDGIMRSLEASVRRDTKAVVAVHVSNICGITLPIARIGRFCRERGLVFIVDAAQSAGHVALNAGECNIDILCAPGHKGLYGPPGTGFAMFSPRLAGTFPATLIEGGSGSNSLSVTMPDELPERLEAGTQNAPAAAGLCAALVWLESYGIEAAASHTNRLFVRLRDMLDPIPDITVYEPEAVGATLLFNSKKIPSPKLTDELNRRGICVRGGFHCTPAAHRRLGTGESGAVRVSFSVFNTAPQLELLRRAIHDITA